MLVGSVSTSTITSILAAAVVLGSALVFPWLQKRGVAAFKPRRYALVVPGTREDSVQRACEALEAARRFSIVEVSDHDFEIKARYRVPPVWADLRLSLMPHGPEKTEIAVTISLLPNLFTLVTVPERRIFARFERSMREQGALTRDVTVSGFMAGREGG